MSLILKKEYREELRKPLGELIKNEKELLEKIKGKEIISVGDMATQTILKRLKPKLAIVDYKIERKKIEFNYKGFLKVARVKNPAGTISREAIEKIRDCLKLENCLIEVDGEEDLLALIAILEGKIGEVVIYGQPKEGIVAVNITKNKKLEVERILQNYFKN